MKLRYPSLALAAALVLVLPAMAGTLYSNGPINGTITDWPISGPPIWAIAFATADSFTLTESSTVTGFNFGLWVEPGDSPASTSWFISSNAPLFYGGTQIAAASGNFSNTLYCTGCALGWDIYTSTISGLNVSLGPGTYFLMLNSGVSANGHPIFWDQNDGPSTAYVYPHGEIPSEAFNIYGSTGGSSVPEPGTLMLLGSGAMGLAGVLRRKMNL